jgi:hypothetical protein
MNTRFERRNSDAAVEELIARFNHATHPREIETIADSLGAAGDTRAIRPLLMHLGDCQVQADTDVEDAVCGALISLGVMCASDTHCFRLRPRRALSDDAVGAVREFSGAIPWQYFGTRSF